jgi:succinoglycan biosynthesis protein ExoM
MTSSAVATISVCVAIPTYRRPERLATLLDALAQQTVPAEYAVTILVLDNDTEPSASDIVAIKRTSIGFPLVYEHVAAPGLCMVRNAAIAFARDRFTLLAMIDDDEIPVASWLTELLRIERETGSDVVIGPVPQLLPPAAPRWIRAGRFFDLPTYEDGAALSFGYSGNCLLNVASIKRARIAFDPTLNFAGGEDMLFFRQLVLQGARLRFAAQAVAVEPIPDERLRVSYLLRLNFRRGNTLALCDRRLKRTNALLISRALKASLRMTFGITSFLPLFVLRGRTGAMIALCNVAQGLGGLFGLGGHIYHAYSRVS